MALDPAFEGLTLSKYLTPLYRRDSLTEFASSPPTRVS
jgi:hypothetical protein